MTDAEIILWSGLRHDAVCGRRFRRQHPIGPYVADFACVPVLLIVEVDGDTHSTPAELAHDRSRDAYLRARGWHVFRVTNEDVYKNLDSVLDGIVRLLPPPGLRPDLPRARGRKIRISVFSSPVLAGEVLSPASAGRSGGGQTQRRRVFGTKRLIHSGKAKAAAWICGVY